MWNLQIKCIPIISFSGEKAKKCAAVDKATKAFGNAV